MRLWIGPGGEMIDLDEEELSHSLYVARRPAMFGLGAEAVDRHLAAVNDPDGDVEFDFDTLIVLAEMNGWVRVSRDSVNRGLALSAADAPAARMALRTLSGMGAAFCRADIELERLSGSCIERSFHSLAMDEVEAFLRRGRLQRGTMHRVPVAETGLLEASVHDEGLPMPGTGGPA